MQPLTALALATAAPVGKFLTLRPLAAVAPVLATSLAHHASPTTTMTTMTGSGMIDMAGIVGIHGGRRPSHSYFSCRSAATTAFMMIPPRHQCHDFDLNRSPPPLASPSLVVKQKLFSPSQNGRFKSNLNMGRMMTTSTSNSGDKDNNNDNNNNNEKNDSNKDDSKNNNEKPHPHISKELKKTPPLTTKTTSTTTTSPKDNIKPISPLYHGEPLQKPAGLLFRYDSILRVGDDDEIISGGSVLVDDDDKDGLVDELDNLLPKAGDNLTEVVRPPESEYFFIPQVKLHDGDGSGRKRVLVLCTGGTLTMAPNPEKGGALSPVPGALTDFMKSMLELTNDKMPDVVVHEYTPLLDSSDMGPPDWALLANDIKANYLHFDGFVILMGTDTMAYTATALSFMLENLGKPVVFTGSQVPIAEPHSDARQNLIMALIFASRNVPICEVTIFFHDRLIRACRSSKVNAGEMHAFDSPNLPPLATVGISIKENEHLLLPQARGALRVHTKMDTRLLALRLVPGFDDTILRHMIKAGAESGSLRALVLQLYGTGNAPMVKDDLIECLREARELGILVIASTQCHRGSVMMGHYATGQALERVGVVSSNDMTLEAISCKVAYLMGRGDLTIDEIGNLMTVSMRGEVTHTDALPPPPFTSAYQRASRKGRYFY